MCQTIKHSSVSLLGTTLCKNFKDRYDLKRNLNLEFFALRHLQKILEDQFSLPAAYMTASMMEEIHATWLYEALKMSWMSLKKTVMALGNA